MTVCNIPADLPSHVLASFLSAYGRADEVTPLRDNTGRAHGDHAFHICLKRDGFQAIPNSITFKGRQMMVVMKGKGPHC